MIRDYKFRSTQSTSLHRFLSVSILEGFIWLFFHKDMLLYTKILLGLYSALTLSFCIWISEGVSWLDITTVTPVYPFPSIWILLDCKKHCTLPSRHQHRKETVFDITIFLRVCSGKEGSLVKEASLDKKAIKIFLLYFHFVFKRMKGGWKTPWPKARKAERKHWPLRLQISAQIALQALPQKMRGD